MPKKQIDSKKNLLEDKVVSIGRVTKVTKGGRHFRFSATVVVGNRKGLVGIGTGKANEVADAIKKAIQAANKNVIKVAIILLFYGSRVNYNDDNQTQMRSSMKKV